MIGELWLDFTLRSTALLGVAALLDAALRRWATAARFRQGLWTAALAAVALLPLFSLSLPSHEVPVLAPAAEEVVLPAGVPALPAPAVVSASDVAIPAAVAESPSRPWASIAAALWVAGACFALARTLRELLRLRSMRRDAAPLSDSWKASAQRAARRLGLRRSVQLGESSRVAVPMTYGWLRPVVLMPHEARAWDESRRDAVLLHELAHVQHGDFLVNLVARFAVALGWYNPLLHWAVRRFASEREAACDRRVLANGARDLDYAACLVELARELRPAPSPGCAVCMVRRSELERRVRAILAAGEGGEVGGRPRLLPALGVAVFFAASLATLHAGARSFTSLSNAELIAQLDAEDAATRQAAIVALGERADRKTFYDVLPLRNDPAPEVRASVQWALGRIGCNPAFVALNAGLDDQDPRVRASALRAMGTFVNRGLEAVPLSEAFPDRYQDTWDALSAAGVPAGTRTAVDNLRTVCNDPDPKLASLAADTLRRLED